jgi:hypothetical protein
MKKQISNIALEGICTGDVAGGLLLWTGKSLQALLFYCPIGLEGEELWNLMISLI